MFNLLFIIGAVLAIVQLLKEAFEKPAPKGTHFDWDAYWEDIKNGIGAMEQVKKCERGDYMTTKPAPKYWYELPMRTVVDVKRYEYDKKTCGEWYAELQRDNGAYRTVDTSKKYD